MKVLSEIAKTIYKHKILVLMLLIGYGLCIKRTTPYVVADEYRYASDKIITINSGENYQADIFFTGEKYYGINLIVNSVDETAGAFFQITDELTGEVIVSSDLNQYTNYVESESLAEYILDSYVNVGPDQTYKITIYNKGENAVEMGCNEEEELWLRPLYLLYSMPIRILINFLFITVTICTLYAVMFLIPGCSKHLNIPENVFLLGSVALGILYMVVLPSFKAPDTVNQYVRAYSIAKGYLLIPEGGIINIPNNLSPYPEHTYSLYVVLHNWCNTINQTESISHDAVNMALYSPISYLFQTVGIFIADIFSNNTYVLLYAGTITSMAGCIAMIYYSIKYIPYGKWVLAYLSLLPMAVQQRASISVDAVTYASVVAMVSFVLYFRCENRQMNRRELTIMYLLIAVTASCKIVYFVTAALILFIPQTAFKERKAWFHKLIAMVELAVMSLGWLLIAKSYLGTTRGGEDMSGKLDIIIHSPFRYIYICCKMLWEEGGNYLLEMIGLRMGATDIEISSLLIIIALIFLVRLYFEDKEKRKEPDGGIESFMLLQSFGMLLLVFTSLYLQWTVLAAATYSIEGIQGRYLLPIAPVLMLGLLSRKNPVTEPKSGAKPMFVIMSIDIIIAMLIWGYVSYLG